MTHAELCEAMNLPRQLKALCLRSEAAMRDLARRRGFAAEVGEEPIGAGTPRQAPAGKGCGQTAGVPTEVVAARLAECVSCPENQSGICLALKRLTPQRPCLIEIGVRMAKAHCPLETPRWTAYVDPLP